jgi:ABC-type ATPase with predicted acetyltransferase domain
MKFTINKAFKTSVERTPRVLEVAEAFGLGLTDKEFVIYRDLEIEVMAGDVVYINGQSGSGKSILLRELSQKMKTDYGLKVAEISPNFAFNDVPVIEQVGTNMSKACEVLSKAGINDAYLLIRKPSELSDGQRYRLQLAILIDTDADVWVADEFGAVLDRTTAKVVAFNMQKAARKLGKILIVATTHEDLVAELAPSLMIRKRYHDRVEIKRELA